MDNYNKQQQQKSPTLSKLQEMLFIFFPLRNILCTQSNPNKSWSDAQTCHMSHFAFPVCFSSTGESWAGCSKASLKITIAHKSALLSLCAACLLVKAEWITGWSHRCHVIGWDDTPQRANGCPRWQHCLFFVFWTWFIVVPLFRPPIPISSWPEEVFFRGVRCGRSRVENLLSLQWEKEREERERKRVHPCCFNPPLHSQTQGCCILIGEREEGRVQLIRSNQPCIDHWSGTVSGFSPSSPLPQSPPLSPPLPFPSAHIRASGPVDRGGPPWTSTVRGWCSSGTYADHLHVQREGVSLGQSRRGLWSPGGGPV